MSDLFSYAVLVLIILIVWKALTKPDKVEEAVKVEQVKEKLSNRTLKRNGQHLATSDDIDEVMFELEEIKEMLRGM